MRRYLFKMRQLPALLLTFIDVSPNEGFEHLWLFYQLRIGKIGIGFYYVPGWMDNCLDGLLRYAG